MAKNRVFFGQTFDIFDKCVLFFRKNYPLSQVKETNRYFEFFSKKLFDFPKKTEKNNKFINLLKIYI